jgi:hypothetical protein
MAFDDERGGGVRRVQPVRRGDEAAALETRAQQLAPVVEDDEHGGDSPQVVDGGEIDAVVAAAHARTLGPSVSADGERRPHRSSIRIIAKAL